MKRSFPSIVSVIAAAAFLSASTSVTADQGALTTDAFYVAPHGAALVDPPCDPIHPSSIWPEPAMPEWATAECWYIYLDERSDAIWAYAECGIDCTFNNPEGPARCACYHGCEDALADRRDECWGNLMECSNYYPPAYVASYPSR